MALFFTLVFGAMAFFGIRNLRRGWAERKTDQVGSSVRLLFGWGMAFFGGIAFLISLVALPFSGMH